MPHDALEYEEEDESPLSDVQVHPVSTVIPNVNPAEPIRSYKPAKPGGTSKPPAPTAQAPSKKGKERAADVPSSERQSASTGRVYKDVDSRLRELQELRRSGKEEYEVLAGARSLKSLSMAVIKVNAVRIWDIGDLEYSLIKPFIDDLPMDQLVEIETNSPHIRNDTDWLWEIFLLQEFPLFHERCQDRRGEPRTSGWRKMYKKAKEDQLHRQSQAIDRVAARYKQLEEEKAAKRIVVLDKAMPERRPSKSGWGRSRAGFGSSGSAGGSAPYAPKPQSAIAKARVEAQRARVALTHASGRYIPPPPSRTRPKGETALFKNPYLSNAAPPSTTGARIHNPLPVDGPRIPPPRRLPRPRGSSPSSPTSPANADLIQGAYPTSQWAQARATLPSHLADRASTHAHEQEERFRIQGSKTKLKEIKRPERAKFQAPKLEKEKKVTGDFFAFGPHASSTAKRDGVATSTVRSMGEKRKLPEDEGEHEVKRVAVSDDRGDPRGSPRRSGYTTSTAGAGVSSTEPIKDRGAHPSPPVIGSTPQRTATATAASASVGAYKARPIPASISADESNRLNSVLFRKKKVGKGK